MSRVLHNPLNGRLTVMDLSACHSYEDAKPQKDSNYWSVTENSSTNARNVNFNNGNVNNNNKSNTNNVVRPVAALDGLEPFLEHVPESARCDEAFMQFLGTVHEVYVDCLRGKMQSKQALAYM